MAATTLISIVIPIYNERDRLESLLDQIATLNTEAAHRKDVQLELEWIFVDGGSQDKSLNYLSNEGISVLSAPLGRAVQMNTGALSASGQWLVFLHADTVISFEYFEALILLPKRVAWGYARVKLDDSRIIAKWVSKGIAFRSLISGVVTGDQTLCIRREIFEKEGGFSALELMEDVELSSRLSRYYEFASLPVSVVTSSRKWQKHGYLKTILLMWFIQLAYRLGVSPKTLRGWYYGSQ